jgi:hypothetical protein
VFLLWAGAASRGQQSKRRVSFPAHIGCRQVRVLSPIEHSVDHIGDAAHVDIGQEQIRSVSQPTIARWYQREAQRRIVIVGVRCRQ